MPAGVAPKSDSRDPQFRNSRIAMYAIHIAVAALFCITVSVGVIRSVVQMSPRAVGSPGALLPPHQCVSEAEALWHLLDEERKEFTRSQPARSVDEEFSHFRVEWLRRFRELEGRCLGNAPERRPLREVSARMDRVMDLYTTHAVQYAGEVGPAVDALLASFAKARQAQR
jgi:hypothetical protein